jgi:hypothetical protein
VILHKLANDIEAMVKFDDEEIPSDPFLLLFLNTLG